MTGPRAVLVTGGATGIGLAIASALGARGATVAIFNRNAERAAAAVQSPDTISLPAKAARSACGWTVTRARAATRLTIA